MQKPKTFRPWQPEQTTLLPPSPGDGLSDDHRVIVAVGVSNQPPDVEHLEPMLQRIATTVGALPDGMTMDADYWSEASGDQRSTANARRSWSR